MSIFTGSDDANSFFVFFFAWYVFFGFSLDTVSFESGEVFLVFLFLLNTLAGAASSFFFADNYLVTTGLAVVVGVDAEGTIFAFFTEGSFPFFVEGSSTSVIL